MADNGGFRNFERAEDNVMQLRRIYRKRKQVYTAKGGDAKCVIEILGGQK